MSTFEYFQTDEYFQKMSKFKIMSTCRLNFIRKNKKFSIPDRGSTKA